jgi:hypothetical protein
MITDQQFQEVLERLSKLEKEIALLRKQTTDSDWEAKIIEQLNKGDMASAVSIYQNLADRHASMSEAMRHVLEIKKKIGK